MLYIFYLKIKLEFNIGGSLKKPTSISLPDICSKTQGKESTAAALQQTSSTYQSCLQLKTYRKNISTIDEEKENPNAATHQLDVVIAVKPLELPKFKSVSVQCKKSDEDMMLGDELDKYTMTIYLKSLALRRLKAIEQIKQANENVIKNFIYFIYLG